MTIYVLIQYICYVIVIITCMHLQIAARALESAIRLIYEDSFVELRCAIEAGFRWAYSLDRNSNNIKETYSYAYIHE